MRRIVLLVLAALAVLAGGVASRATAPPGGAGDERAPRPVAHRVHVWVSGPPDTLMWVVRGRARTPVELGGEPFDFSFAEPPGSTGYRDIAVSATSERPTPDRPLTCRITVNGETVAQQEITNAPGPRPARVVCEVPAEV
ncbi:hypothetical protein B0I33_110286 [Prauserella shujinwangii]|uniref:MmpS family membrane protein n=1 Tax=Prauserella shujinwangii TaxID=1453103 RepID=A0A2T0LPU9_9PSEU|nr:hypothetical protein [Prauserella shujinwangii]PRX45186.1 hypothetical protein B0I33_110286 [Prauserella shujinwangii]